MENSIEAAATYSMNKGAEFAYELTYEQGRGVKGYKVRAVVMANGMMRVESKMGAGAGWEAGKPYIVKKNRKRQGDRIVAKVKAILAA